MKFWIHDLTRLYDKLDKIMIYLKGLLPTNLPDPLVTWFSKITLQTKTTTSSLPQCLWPVKFAGWWLTMRVFHPESHMTLWSRDHVRSRDNQNPLYLHILRGESHIGFRMQCVIMTEIKWAPPPANSIIFTISIKSRVF